MNTKELIKHYKDMSKKLHVFPVVAISRVLEDLRQLDESQKVTVPQFVADYIEYAKEVGWNLLKAMKNVPYEDNAEFRKWFYKGGNVEVFASAWLDGYEVEKEQRYLVKVKGVGSVSFLNHDIQSDLWSINDENNSVIFKTHHTRKELEDAGFGDVFDSPLFEVEEVQE